MSPLLDSFWRASAYCLRPRVIGLSLLPLLLIALLAVAGGYFLWEPGVLAVQGVLMHAPWLETVWTWLKGWGWSDPAVSLAPLLLILALVPLIVMVALLGVALMMTPAMVQLVAERRFPQLARKRGGSFAAGAIWSLGCTALALLALIVSMPLWLIPPLVLIVPPLIWGWLTYRVMAYDALAEHASKEERQTLFKRHRSSLLLIGIVCGYLGAAPSIVWASTVLFAAAFVVLIPIAIWIYTLVFAFSSLWFTHYALASLERLRAERGDLPMVDIVGSEPAALRAIPTESARGAAQPPAAPHSTSTH